MAKKKEEPQVQKKSVEVVKEERIQGILKDLEPLMFDEKIQWFTEHYKANRMLYLGNELTDENFLCYCIAEMKQSKNFTNIDEAIEIQLEHMNLYLKNPNNTNAVTNQRVKRNMKYIEGLDKKEFKEFENLTWENKTNLVFLIYALEKSKEIQLNGKPINQKKLIEVFSGLLNVDLKNFHDLLRSGMNTSSRSIDKKYFTLELHEYLLKYIEDK